MGDTLAEQKAKRDREYANKAKSVYYLFDTKTNKRVFEAKAKDGNEMCRHYEKAAKNDSSLPEMSCSEVFASAGRTPNARYVFYIEVG